MNIMTAEQAILKRSIRFTIILASLGISFGLVSGSLAIVFDGMFSAVDAGMCSLAFLVSKILAQPDNRKFQYGFWHLEPLVLAFNGSILTFICIYAFIGAILDIMAGGRDLTLGFAMIYSAAVSFMAFWIYAKHKRLNRKIESDLVALDTQSWFMAASISASLLVAFTLALILQQTQYAYLSRYMDSGVLLVLIVWLIPKPIKMATAAIKEVLQMTPESLNNSVTSLMERLKLGYGFKHYRFYATQIGRGMFIEIHVVVDGELAQKGVAYFDEIRQAISDELGDNDGEMWFTVSFTCDEKWI
ncbi:cation diffusion facilitator family transporter [Thorsellia anophelis]|uniref:Predicted Co/Zn/Cd cation transporter, cation efflux family n=1 Tax=Thorsellia anophelis DSM 18579 TaxID=1123402 RepID=A0A1I0BD47_9GAMM|nr:cation transporter [Thorsellia anophelis]SET04076.1 Predicted Co/Zn/Cd cation transporter, cation efflux family [Thorsellia anophelis DSM 18579]